MKRTAMLLLLVAAPTCMVAQDVPADTKSALVALWANHPVECVNALKIWINQTDGVHRYTASQAGPAALGVLTTADPLHNDLLTEAAQNLMFKNWLLTAAAAILPADIHTRVQAAIDSVYVDHKKELGDAYRDYANSADKGFLALLDAVDVHYVAPVGGPTKIQVLEALRAAYGGGGDSADWSLYSTLSRKINGPLH